MAELKQQDWTLHGAAAQRLGEMGPTADAATPLLIAELKKPLAKEDMGDQRLPMVQALVAIAGPKEALPVIADLLDANQLPGHEAELR